MTRCIAMLALIAFYCLAGCGQKGPLKLPDPETEASETEMPETEPAKAGQNGNEQE